MAILQDLLLSSFVRDVISRVRLPGRFLSRHFGWGFDGGGLSAVQSLETVTGRVYTYDIFDNVRTVANARLPNAPSGTVAANPVGNVTVNLARFAEKLPLDYNQLNQIRTIGKGASDRDRAGASYIDRQVKYLRQRADNVWEFLAAAVFNGGKYGFYQLGDDLIPTLNTTGTFFGVDMKIEPTNLSLGATFAAAPGLYMGQPVLPANNLIPIAWSDTINAQIMTNILNISSAFQDIVGAPLEEIYCGSDVWMNVLANLEVRTKAGSANEPFAAFTMEPEKGPDGTPLGLMRGRIRGLPFLDFLIWDGSLRLATTSASTFGDVKVLPRGYCHFAVGERPAWLKGIQGSEIVKDNDWTEPVERYGLYTWAMERADPARVWYHTLQNIGVELNVPKALATARVQ